jgi:hypothetical protein
MRLAIACLLATLIGPSLAQGRDIFVDNVNGDDRKGGQSADSQGEVGGPCRSIAKALRIARPGDRIVVANTGEPYRECLSIQGASHSGDARFPFQIVGNGATLDGTGTLADARWEYLGNDTYRTRPARMSHQQLFLDDQPLARKPLAAGKPPELAPREWCLVEGWIVFRCEPTRLPQTYNLSCCLHPVGITLYQVQDVIVENLVVRGFYLDGVNCHDGVTRTDLVSLACKDNGRSGISVGGASRVRLDTCAVSGNGTAQVRTEAYSLVQTVDCKLDATSAPPIVSQGGRVVAE